MTRVGTTAVGRDLQHTAVALTAEKQNIPHEQGHEESYDTDHRPSGKQKIGCCLRRDLFQKLLRVAQPLSYNRVFPQPLSNHMHDTLNVIAKSGAV